MKGYRLKIGDEEIEIRPSVDTREGQGTAEIDGTLHRFWFLKAGEGVWKIGLGDRCFRVITERSQDQKMIFINGEQYLVSEARTPKRGPGTWAEKEASRRVSPPTPSMVVKILVEEGQVVEAGQALLVVSAMKMETTLRAPFKGKVRKVKTHVGARVGPEDELVDIQEIGESNG